MTERAWKRTERGVARVMGGERAPVNGRGAGSDVLHDRFAIEVKDRGDVPEWIRNAIKQAETARYVEDKSAALVILHMPGQHIGSSLAVLKLRDLMRILMEGGDSG